MDEAKPPPPYEQPGPTKQFEGNTLQVPSPAALQGSPAHHVQGQMPVMQQQPAPVYMMQQPAPVQIIQQPPVQFVQQAPPPTTERIIITQPVVVNRNKDYYFTLSTIMNTFCFFFLCCGVIVLPCTILALVFSIMAKQMDKNGNPGQAKALGKMSLAFNIIAIITAIIIFIVYMIVVPVSIVSSASDSRYYRYSRYYYYR